eukprot:1860229-Prymnesium_polylepis.3
MSGALCAARLSLWRAAKAALRRAPRESRGYAKGSATNSANERCARRAIIGVERRMREHVHSKPSTCRSTGASSIPRSCQRAAGENPCRPARGCPQTARRCAAGTTSG